MKDLSYCPNCGKKTLSYIDKKKWVCSNCKLSLYNNVAAAVGLIIIIKDGLNAPISCNDEDSNYFHLLPHF